MSRPLLDTLDMHLYYHPLEDFASIFYKITKKKNRNRFFKTTFKIILINTCKLKNMSFYFYLSSTTNKFFCSKNAMDFLRPQRFPVSLI